ncbi:MAG: hydroxymethylbilane synthase [Nitrososphaerales archaeon]
MKESIVIGTRGSPLALAQTKLVVNMLKKKNRRVKLGFKIKIIKTEGDLRGSGKDSFTRSIDLALESSEIDIAIHSLKDVPVDPNSKLEVAALPKRDSPYDVLIAKRSGETLQSLPSGARVGTSSKRRAVQLKSVRPDIEIVEIHGNVETRIRKLHESNFLDAIILAKAGLKRLGLSMGSTLPKKLMLPAAGQGCLAIVVRRNDSRVKSIVSTIDDANTRSAVTAERAFSSALGGGCNTPIAALAIVRGKKLVLEGLAERADSHLLVARSSIEGPAEKAETLGKKLALQLKRLI